MVIYAQKKKKKKLHVFLIWVSFVWELELIILEIFSYYIREPCVRRELSLSVTGM